MDSNIRANSFAITGCIGHRTADLHPPLRRLLTDPEPLQEYIEIEQETGDTGEELFADVTLSQYDDEDRDDSEEEVAEGTDVVENDEQSDREQ